MDPWLIGLLVVVAVGLAYAQRQIRGSVSHAGPIQRALDRHGFRLVSTRTPGFVEVMSSSPFPKVEVHVGAHSQVGPVRGEDTEYRVCQVEGPGGPQELWTRVRIERFKVVAVDFLPELPELPPS